MEIINNKNLLKWYVDKTPINKDEVDKIYHRFMSAYSEDDKQFMRIIGYISGTRTHYTNVHYKLALHFLATNYPDKLLANLDLLLKFGHISDIKYLLQEQTISNRILKYINYHKNKFKDVDNIEIPTLYKKYFKYRLKKYDYNELLDKINNDTELKYIF